MNLHILKNNENKFDKLLKQLKDFKRNENNPLIQECLMDNSCPYIILLVLSVKYNKYETLIQCFNHCNATNELKDFLEKRLEVYE